METNNQPSSSSSVPKIVGGIVAILVCCSCVLIRAQERLLTRSIGNTIRVSSHHDSF